MDISAFVYGLLLAIFFVCGQVLERVFSRDAGKKNCPKKREKAQKPPKAEEPKKQLFPPAEKAKKAEGKVSIEKQWDNMMSYDGSSQFEKKDVTDDD